jgi:hypothetical protein
VILSASFVTRSLSGKAYFGCLDAIDLLPNETRFVESLERWQQKNRARLS